MQRLIRPNSIVRAVAVLMLLAQAVVHLNLYNNGYRNIPTIGPMFLAGIFAAVALAIAVAVTSRRPVILAGLAVSLGQVAALVLTRVTGLFGFMTAGSLSSDELSAVGAELLAAVALGVLFVIRQRRANDTSITLGRSRG